MIKPLQLTQTQLQAIQDQAEKAYPQECCGLLLGHLELEQQICVEVWPTENAWTPAYGQIVESESASTQHGRHDRFWIDPRAILKAQKHGRDRSLNIIGIYHSHPNHPAVPSEHDRRYAWSQYAYLIISIQDGKAIDHQSWLLDEQQQFQSQQVIIV
jgi:proteasome lid subunit RPN8/RPN11